MSNGVHDAQRLKELQSLDLNYKIMITQARIIDWYEHYNGNVCVSFSGGKDSTVLLHIARKVYPDIPAVFSNTGLEYPEIQKFVKGFDNVDIVTPSMNFGQVITEFGYPIIGKEVAEAIYYARRIRSQSPNVERERERERERTVKHHRREMYGQRISSKPPQPGTDAPSCKGDGARSQLETNGNRGGQNRRRAEISGSLTTDENLNRQRRAGVAKQREEEGTSTEPG